MWIFCQFHRVKKITVYLKIVDTCCPKGLPLEKHGTSWSTRWKRHNFCLGNCPCLLSYQVSLSVGGYWCSSVIISLKTGELHLSKTRLCIIHVSWSAYLNAKVRTNIFVHMNIQVLHCLYYFICTILSESKSINPIESLLEKRKKRGKIWAITDVYIVACAFKLENWVYVSQPEYRLDCFPWQMIDQ